MTYEPMIVTAAQVATVVFEMEHHHSEKVEISRWNSLGAILVKIEVVPVELVILPDGRRLEWKGSLADLAEQILNA